MSQQGTRITKSMWNGLPDKDKRQHKDGSKLLRIKVINPDGSKSEKWERVYWLS